MRLRPRLSRQIWLRAPGRGIPDAARWLSRLPSGRENPAMLVHGAIIPPGSALAALDAVVRSVALPAEAAAVSAPPQRGLLGRLGRHREDAAELVIEAPPMLEHVPIG